MCDKDFYDGDNPSQPSTSKPTVFDFIDSEDENDEQQSEEKDDLKEQADGDSSSDEEILQDVSSGCHLDRRKTLLS